MHSTHKLNIDLNRNTKSIKIIKIAAKFVAALLRIARVTAGLVESSGSLPPGLRLTSLAG